MLPGATYALLGRSRQVMDAVEVLRKAADQGEGAVVARIVEIEGFSTRPGDDLLAIDAEGSLHGTVLAGLASGRLLEAAGPLLAGNTTAPALVTVDVGDKDAVAAGLACGGRARMLLHPSQAIPPELWRLLAARAPAALLTRSEGAVVVDRDGNVYGDAPGRWPVDAATALLVAGRVESGHVESPDGDVLLESWVPEPRIVIVGTGELLAAIGAQSALLGWETASTNSVDDPGGLLEWAGATGALVVLSHDPHVDTPALADGLASGVAYVGALGSRSTQSKRTERLLARGVPQSDIDRIHRPVGLDLGGRRAPEVALAIVAEVLASHHGRDARPLSARTGPIH